MLAREIGRESTKMDLSTVYRVFMRVLSPKTILSAAGRVFNTYYRLGRMNAPEVREGFARVVMEGCVGFDRNVFQDCIGGSEVALEMAGAKNLRVHITRGGQDGDEFLECNALWT